MLVLLGPRGRAKEERGGSMVLMVGRGQPRVGVQVVYMT